MTGEKTINVNRVLIYLLPVSGRVYHLSIPPFVSIEPYTPTGTLRVHNRRAKQGKENPPNKL